MSRHLFLLASAFSAQILVHGQSFVTINTPFDPGLTVVRTTNQIEVTWRGEGILEHALSPAGSWTPVATNSAAATNRSSWLAPAELGQEFFRVRNPHPRPVQLFVPSVANTGTPLPLVILLHGYTGNGAGVENYMKFLPLAEGRGFFYCYPDGTLDADGYRGWNSDPAPNDCLHPGSRVDDIAFLRSLIKEIVRTQPVDPQQIYLIGHSNGGDMAYRMAHDESALIAGIASLAGPDRAAETVPSEPVNILYIIGTADDFYNGTTDIAGCPVTVPPAMTIVERWAAINGATGLQTELQPSMDLVGDVPGPDTIVTRYTNAPAGGAVELWTIQGGSHVPPLTSAFAPAVADWLLSHPRPAQ